MRGFVRLASMVSLCTLQLVAQDSAAARRPFGTLRDQADTQQAWLAKRLEQTLPALMRKHGVDMWVMPMREYNEDPAFSSLVSPTTFFARRRTIYVFFDRGPSKGVERLALGGSSQGGMYDAVRSTKPATNIGHQLATAELWGDQQWEVLKKVIVDRQPKVIAVNVSRVTAFADGLSAGEYDGMRDALGPEWQKRIRPAGDLAVEFIATRLPEEEAFYRSLQELVWQLTQEMFSGKTIKPGVTTTADLEWWWRQRVNDLGLGTWFQPSVSVQRKGATAEQLGEHPVIERGDLLWCDVGITALRLNTDTQHDAYVLRDGETDAPDGLKQALRNANRLQDMLFAEIRPGKTGNQVLASTLTKMRGEKLDGTLYTHPIGMHGHGAGPLIGLWDYQDGVPGRGEHKVIPNMWFSSELQVTSPVPEWGGQTVRMAQEEDFVIGPDGTPHWALRRQDKLFLVR